MRNPLGDSADQRRTRRRGKDADVSDPTASERGASERGASGRGNGRRGAGGRGNSSDATDRGVAGGLGDQAGREAAAGSLFAPGYGTRPPESPDRDGTGGTGGRTSGASTWYGSAAGGAAGRGPVRGYPPGPGQPPPMYPPGQFAAWNRGPGRAGGVQSGPNGPGSRSPGLSGASGREAQDSRAATGGAASNPGFPPAWPPGAADSEPAKSRYYPQDFGSGAEPGYSMLAVSDPAADMTSTQTWQAVGDGRATGMWTAPARPGGPEAGRAGRGPAVSAPGSTPDSADAEAGSGRRGPADPSDAAGVLGGVAGDARDTAGHPRATASRAGLASDQAGADASEPGRRGGRGHSGAHTSPRQLPRSQRGADEPAGPAEPPRPPGAKRRRKHPANVKVAIATALVLVLAAAAALSYAALHRSGPPAGATAGAGKPPRPSPSTSPSPSLGPYGHIASRQTDPAPLTIVDLYPATFTTGGTTIVRTAASRGPNCAANLVGSGIQSAIGPAGCSQVVRATYLASTPGVMGTIGVLNLSTASAAKTAARSADATDFISQLTASSGPTSKIGQGTGIEEAAAKGHYLILIWAEFTSLRKPRTAAQRTTIEQFMTQLLENTANVSLTSRMLTGTP